MIFETKSLNVKDKHKISMFIYSYKIKDIL